MHNDTRRLFNDFLARQAQLNGVSDATQKFHIAPAVEQRLEEKIQESSDFLRLINVVMVDNQEGEKVMVGTSGTVAGRTDTSAGQERQPQNISSSTGHRYRCEQTNYDTYVPYSLLDSWRHNPNFMRLLRSAQNKQIGRDRLCIGFNGTSVAATTNRATNSLLQDVNKGWLQQLRDHKPAAVMSGKKIGALSGQDYHNIDAAVFDARNELIEPWARGAELVVISGRKLLAEKYFAKLNGDNKPTETEALNRLLLDLRLGSLPTLAVPFFPDDAFMITPLNNLSIYVQRGATRTVFIDDPRRNRVEEYRSVNEAYVVEDYDACCLVEGIKVPKADGSGWE